MEILIFLAVYLLSAFLVWKFICKAYGVEGKWHGLHPNMADMFFTFIPIVNTYLVVLLWVIIGWRKVEDECSIFDKFFKIK